MRAGVGSKSAGEESYTQRGTKKRKAQAFYTQLSRKEATSGDKSAGGK